jgi:hypothetical protein
MSQCQAQEGLMQPVAEAGHYHLNQTDFGSLLQEQLARLRRSWHHEIQQPPSPPDETAAFELQDMLGSPVSAWTNPEMATGVRMVAGVRVQQRVVAHRVQEAVNSTPPTPATLMPDAEWLTETCNDLDEGHNDGGAGSEPQEPHLPVGPTASLDPDQDSLTPRQRALHVARQRLQIARTSIESFQIVQTLAVALGAIHVEGGTIKALLAVLLQMDRPGMSDTGACTSTGASLSSFKRWRRRVQYARLDLPPPP